MKESLKSSHAKWCPERRKDMLDNLGFVKQFFITHSDIFGDRIPKSERMVSMCEDLQEGINEIGKVCGDLY